MNRRNILVFPMLTMARLSANPAKGNPRLERLYSMFMSPCCWRENLMVHQSEQAENLRATITGMVEQGQSDDQIRAALIQRYSIRILAMPPGVFGNWLRWTPITVVVAAFCGMPWIMKRMARSKSVEPWPAVGDLPDLPREE